MRQSQSSLPSRSSCKVLAHGSTKSEEHPAEHFAQKANTDGTPGELTPALNNSAEDPCKPPTPPKGFQSLIVLTILVSQTTATPTFRGSTHFRKSRRNEGRKWREGSYTLNQEEQTQVVAEFTPKILFRICDKTVTKMIQ